MEINIQAIEMELKNLYWASNERNKGIKNNKYSSKEDQETISNVDYTSKIRKLTQLLK